MYTMTMDRAASTADQGRRGCVVAEGASTQEGSSSTIFFPCHERIGQRPELKAASSNEQCSQGRRQWPHRPECHRGGAEGEGLAGFEMESHGFGRCWSAAQLPKASRVWISL
mmetsp:Transcript_89935/g.214847  ORF Transcript_89935/g.214847 Transcript_89935/m.214847 type:complete len:112 (-) Transcript_89935:40-375(-)